ncbi:MAG: MarR family transcriptional regulator [Actinomycetota bacterium]|nr:MarR family transcriptional regulator [Actinomycetota bacterium]
MTIIFDRLPSSPHAGARQTVELLEGRIRRKNRGRSTAPAGKISTLPEVFADRPGLRLRSRSRMESFKGHFVVALEKLDLSMSQGHVLMCLDEPVPMSAIARRMGFDASHITALIDRLEERTE